MSINWDTIDKEMGGNYKEFAPDGKYTVECNDIEIKEVGTNGSIIMKFGFAEGDYKYPTADHWLTFKEGKENFRRYHNRNLMMVLGATKENAQKAVELCESKSGKDAITNAYEQTFKKLLSKSPKVEIEVYTEGKYAKAEFTDRSVAFPRNTEVKPEKETEALLDDAEEISDSDLPFWQPLINSQ